MRIEAEGWPQPIISIVDLAAAGGRCDLLIAPSSVRDALAAVLSFAGRIKSSCLVVTGEIGGANESFDLAELLLKQTGAEALALVNPDNQPLEQWILALLRHISHDAPLDIALASSLGAPSERPFYFLTANSDWIDGARLSSIAAKLRDSLEAEGLAAEELAIDPELAKRLYLPQGDHSLPELRQFADYYMHETDGATTLALLSNAVAPKLRQVTRPAERRYLQARVIDRRRGAERAPMLNFLAGALHRIDVQVGPRIEEWVNSDETFSEERLPPSPQGHWLTVVGSTPFTAPQTGRIFLPARGKSTRCSFDLEVAEDQERVQMRIAVLYKNRVLQTSMLEGPALRDSIEVVIARGISFAPEVVVSPGMADLDIQGSFDAAIIMNHTAAGLPQMLKVVDEHAELINTGNLSQSVELIQDELTRADWNSKTFRSLAAPGTEALLRFLAIHGSLLHRGVVKGQFVDAAMASAKRMQLIAARPGIRLPVEYFYDRPSPAKEAVLCPSAAKALSNGVCGIQCRANNRYVCPLGFWGMTKVLEWHTYRPQAARELSNSDFAIQDNRNSRRKQLNVLERAVVAASDRANAQVKQSVPRLMTALRKYDVPSSVASNWEDWKTKIAALHPSLLILIPHTDIDEDNKVAELEIGSKQWLTVDQIDESYIGQGRSQPVVLLLGCETSRNDIVFEDFISNFMLSGAAIVVASSTLVLGRQATVLAAEFVKAIKNTSKKRKTTFGDVMLAVRRTMLKKGYPMVLSVASWGDADWRM